MSKQDGFVDLTLNAPKPVRPYPFDGADSDANVTERSKPQPDAPSPLLQKYLGVSVEKLIEKITFSPDENVMNYFLLCYRQYISPVELFELLQMRYNGPPESYPAQLAYYSTNKNRIQGCVLVFLQRYLQTLLLKDFEGPQGKHFQEDLQAFYMKVKGSSLDLQENAKRSPNAVADVEFTEMMSKLDINKAQNTTLEITPEVIAHSITYVESKLLQAVLPQEFLGQAWMKKDNRSPHIQQLVTKFNWVTKWISSKILKQESPSNRAEVISVFVKVARVFYQLKNFNGLMEVLSCFQSSPISRLKETWAVLDEQSKAELETLNKVMAPEKNFKNYREALEQVEGAACIPCIGLFLTDMTFIDEANPIRLDSDHLSLEYLNLMGSKLYRFREYQKRNYSFKFLALAIYNELAWEEDDLYRVSRLVEQPITDGSPMIGSLNRKSGNRVLNKRMSLLRNDDFIPVVPECLLPDDWHVILTNSETTKLAKGSTIFNEGDPIKEMYLLKSGRLVLKKSLGSSRGLVEFATIQPGEFFCEAFYLGAAVSPYSTSVEEDSVVVAINNNFITQLFESKPELAARFYKNIANCVSDRIRNAMGRIVNQQTSIATSSGVSGPGLVSSPSINSRPSTSVSALESGTRDVVIKTFTCKKGVLTGTFSVTKHNARFEAKALGIHKKSDTRLGLIADATVANKTLVLECVSKTKKYIMKTTQDATEAADLLKSLLSIGIGSDPTSSITAVSNNNLSLEDGASPKTENAKELKARALANVMTKDDWVLFFKGMKCPTFPPGHEFVVEGTKPKAIYQIVSGNCAIQKNSDGKPIVIARRHAGDIFGEMSFLDSSAIASATVVAETEVQIYILELNFVNILLNIHSYLAPKFFKYLGMMLENRFEELGRV